MPAYVLAVQSEHCTFSIGFEAESDQISLEHAGRLIAKAHVAPSTFVRLIKSDGIEIDAGDQLKAFFDRPHSW